MNTLQPLAHLNHLVGLPWPSKRKESVNIQGPGASAIAGGNVTRRLSTSINE